jgi:hypothetical protein
MRIELSVIEQLEDIVVGADIRFSILHKLVVVLKAD